MLATLCLTLCLWRTQDPSTTQPQLQASTQAEAPRASIGHYNLNKDGLALQGYDPVAYFTQELPVMGAPAHEAVHLVAKLAYLASALHLDAVSLAEWLTQAADKGNREAQYGLGMAFLRGRGTQKSDSTGYTWLKKAADQGRPLGRGTHTKGVGARATFEVFDLSKTISDPALARRLAAVAGRVLGRTA